MVLLSLRHKVLVPGLLALAGVLGLFWAHGPADEGGPGVVEAGPPLAVNGHAALASRRYDEVAYATTHNANSSRDEQYFFPNQLSGMRRQLQDGVRALMIDVHMDNGRPALCHGDCRLGRQDFVAGLREIAGFMDAHPHEVVTLILEQTDVPANTLARAFADSGILAHAYAHAPGAPWPVLREMVETGQRLVVFTDRDTGGYPWLHAMWEHLWDTHWSVRELDAFDCACHRGDPANALFVLNHFITNPLPYPATAQLANDRDFLLDRAMACWQESGRIPNFVTVDYYELGNVFDVVDHLNGVTPEIHAHHHTPEDPAQG